MEWQLLFRLPRPIFCACGDTLSLCDDIRYREDVAGNMRPWHAECAAAEERDRKRKRKRRRQD